MSDQPETATKQIFERNCSHLTQQRLLLHSLVHTIASLPDMVHTTSDGRVLRPSENRTSLDFTFETKELRDVCESADLATHRFGEMIARNLRRVLAELAAASSLQVYLKLTAITPRSTDGLFDVPLSGGTVLIVKQGHRKPPLDTEGDLIFAEVRRVKVVNLKVQHD
jgi:hypothetical protein